MFNNILYCILSSSVAITLGAAIAPKLAPLFTFRLISLAKNIASSNSFCPAGILVILLKSTFGSTSKSVKSLTDLLFTGVFLRLLQISWPFSTDTLWGNDHNFL